MPPQQSYGLLDLIDQVLDLGTHDSGSLDDPSDVG
jgi:hypothetical protein